MWSVISAAFIGPGTVTTASRAGSSFGLTLVWALLFSVIATYVLQETTARLTMASGRSFGDWIDTLGWKSGPVIKIGLFAALFIGCAAFQSGNLLGAQEGIKLLGPENQVQIKIALVGISLLVLLIGSPQMIARILGTLVAVMSICYVWLAIQIQAESNTLLVEDITPGIPPGSGWLVAGLIGTTVVPYNLFLGSGLAKGKNIKEMRISLGIAIGLGGLITLAIMITGTEIPPDFTFRKMYTVFAERGNSTFASIAAGGLVAAGLSSAITCPLAAAMGASILLGNDHPKMKSDKMGYQVVWMLVLGIGAMFLFLNSKPIPAIISAQAINGILLPLIVFFLLILANDEEVTGLTWKNSKIYNILSGVILLAITWISINSLQILCCPDLNETITYTINTVFSFAAIILFIRIIKA